LHFIPWQPVETALPRFIKNELWNMRRGYSMVMTGSNSWKIRTAKSVTALRLASLVDPTFNEDTVTERVFYKPSELLTALDYVGRRKEYGRAFIVDEAEEMISNTAWQSSMNRSIALTAATGGYRRTFIIWVTPTLNYIDKRIRLLLNGWGMTQLEMGRNEMKASMRFYQISTNDVGDRLWRRKIPFYDKEEHKVIRSVYYDVGLPNKNMLDAYTAHSYAAKDALNLRLRKTIENEEKEILGEKTLADFDRDLLLDKLKQDDLISGALAKKGKVSYAQVEYVVEQMKKSVPVRKLHSLTTALNMGEKTKE